MNEKFYIWNTVNDTNFDPIENKFYTNKWEPQFTEDKEQLNILMFESPKKFENCIIVEH